MSEEKQEPSPVLPLTRRERREVAHGRAPLPRRATAVRPLTIAGTVALAALIALTGYASPRFVVLAVALGGLVLAWGWPWLLGLPSPRGTTGVLAAGTLLLAVAVLLTPNDPWLRWMPAALAVAVIGAFLHQLLRRDGRPRLTESMAASIAGLAIIAAGTAYSAVPHALDGSHALACAMAGLGVGALADPLIAVHRTRKWALFIAMLAGGLAAMAVAVLGGGPSPALGALLGLLTAAVSHAARRVLAPLPAAAHPRSQLASAAASSLLPGVVVFTVVFLPIFSR